MNLNLDAANVALAALALVLGLYTGSRAERRSHRLGVSTFAADWLRDLRTWASEAVDVLAELTEALPDSDGSEAKDTTTVRALGARLSALIDRGRFYLPNYVPERFGKEKSLAFRGLRHPAVDYLVAAYDIAMRNNWPERFDSQRAAFVEARREFISHVQEVLDPRSQNLTVAQLIRETRTAVTETRTALERMAEPAKSA